MSNFLLFFLLFNGAVNFDFIYLLMKNFTNKSITSFLL